MVEKKSVGDGSIASFNRDFMKDIIIKNDYKYVLELGTHKGISGESILQALEKTNGGYFDTVDIVDVNSIETNKYKKYGPYELPKKIFSKYKTPFYFHSNGSDIFFENNNKKYDFIFIDGSHKKNDVKRDILNSFKFIMDKGIILLHDYFHNGEPKWEGRKAILGIWQAVVELENEGYKFKKDPIDTINGNKTSFCILEV